MTLLVRDACGGVELHWKGKPEGESLQGWYPSRTQARKAAKAIPGATLNLGGAEDVLCSCCRSAP